MRLVLAFFCLLVPIVKGCITQHHNQCLVIDSVQYVVNTPARCIRYLPYKTKGAMGTFKSAR